MTGFVEVLPHAAVISSCACRAACAALDRVAVAGFNLRSAAADAFQLLHAPPVPAGTNLSYQIGGSAPVHFGM